MQRSALTIVCTLVGAATSLSGAAEPAFAAPERVAAAAEHSVAAAEHPTTATAAFAFGPNGAVVAAGALNGSSLQGVTRAGASIDAEITGSRDGLGVAHMSNLPLRALTASRAQQIRAGTAKWVIGPPLASEGPRIRRVATPTLRLTTDRLVTVRGSLPPSFVGAPVVTQHGALLGAVASVGNGTWRFAPLSVIKDLTASNHNPGPPLIPIVLGALIVFVGGVAVGRSRAQRRREREKDLRVRQRRSRNAASGRADGPLVRLRTPPEPAEDSPTPAEEDDFEVVVKPRQEDA